jgi:hypothetical protein
MEMVDYGWNYPLQDYTRTLMAIGSNFGEVKKRGQVGGAMAAPGSMDEKVQSLLEMGRVPEARQVGALAEAQKRTAGGGVPSGFRPRADGGLEPIPGGPGDPEYLRSRPQRQNVQAAPSGYLWNDPNDPAKGLSPVPGGPATKLPAETAARLGMIRSFQGQYPALREKLARGDASGAYDATLGAASIGEQGDIRRQIDSGAEALLRSLTGAGMNKDEASDYIRRYQFSFTDTAETKVKKLDQLNRELTYIDEAVRAGRDPSEILSSHASAGDGAPKQGKDIPQQAIDALKADPSLKDQFEEFYDVSAGDYLQ